MADFLQTLRSGPVLLMDGAMGTELQRAGLGEGECGEGWNLTQPERVRAVHRSYILSGALCLLTNTFQSNPLALARHGLADRLEEINHAAVGIARSVCGAGHFVLASIGPVIVPREAPSRPAHALGQVVRSLQRADALLLETYSVAELAPLLGDTVVDSAANPEGLPVLLSIAYRQAESAWQRLAPGSSERWTPNPAKVAEQVSRWGVAALGVNCGRDIDMEDAAAILRQYRDHTDLPLFARPNAGTPVRQGERWLYRRTPAQMAAQLPLLLEAGACMVGGCCGTTPEHIAAFGPVVAAWNARKGGA